MDWLTDVDWREVFIPDVTACDHASTISPLQHPSENRLESLDQLRDKITGVYHCWLQPILDRPADAEWGLELPPDIAGTA
jgi:hypothetical protein